MIDYAHYIESNTNVRATYKIRVHLLLSGPVRGMFLDPMAGLLLFNFC
jgi:hypothetical protein